ASLLLDEAAQLSLQRHLLQMLTSLALDTLYSEFVRVREQVGTNVPTSDGSVPLDKVGLYGHFLRHMSKGGLVALLQTYSALADLLATTCDGWISANTEFVQRLVADWSAIAQIFSADRRPERVVQMQPALSDMHTGRRCVMALTFDNGVRLVYKPRALGMEEIFYTLLSRCHAQGADLPCKIPALLTRAEYGWMEFITYEPCQDQPALLRYYERAGILLCLVYILGGRNCFSDHLIAHGEHPVLVDASTLMQPYLSPNPQPGQGEDWEQELYSVLDTGLLTTWQRRSSKSGWYNLDISGLGLDQVLATSRQDSAGLLTSQGPLMLKYGVFKTRPALHIAFCTDPAGLPEQEELHASLCAGFRRAYQSLLQQHTALLAADSPLYALKAQKVRITYRDRQVYERLLPKLLKPEALHRAASRSLILTQLERESVPTQWFRMNRSDPTCWRVVSAAEQQALLRHEIPVISARADSDALTIGADQEVASCLFQPAFDLLLTRLERLSVADLQRQYALLQRVLLRKAAPDREASEQYLQLTGRAQKGSNVPASERLEEQPYGIPAAMLISQALSIADDIVRDAIDIDGETVTWVGASVSSHIQYYQLQVMRFGLYDGVSGIALFLAAAARSSGRRSYGRLALAALRPLPRLLREDGARLVHEMGLGAGPGLGSLIYALTRIAQLLNEPELLEYAKRAARLITPALIAADEFFEILLGTAGTTLGLLALYDAAPAPDLLDLAVRCGRRLVDARTPSKVGCRAWPTLGRRHTTGFAHGTAGIVYALLRLYERTGDADFLLAAQEGLLYEEKAFVPALGNWREAVDEDASVLMTGWCHGAPGIGLARVGGLSILDTISIRRDIEVALHTTAQSGSQGALHLCCGASGRAELLLTAAQRLGRPELVRAAMQCMERVVSGVQRSGGGFLDAFFPRGLAHHSLFQGTAGIGYTLLRLAQPEIVPSILLWE
ncbi:MAG TPA: type 2 lanthipeptide synthetase LanM family protein, partial [Ktedonobacteraceae bacterium]|nr:type 2 lanthipeptide synthetase LanM family protein [Ktedonobacteraceae bacterium]